MKIAVCIKQVPNTTEIKIDPVTNTLKRDGVPSIINPDDKAALEAQMKKGAEEAAYYARKTLSKVQRKLGFVQIR